MTTEVREAEEGAEQAFLLFRGVSSFYALFELSLDGRQEALWECSALSQLTGWRQLPVPGSRREAATWSYAVFFWFAG